MNLRYENQKIKQGYQFVIGCDEVGRGSLAGPVVAAAVVFDALKIKDKGLRIKEIKDSKLLTPAKRVELSQNIKTFALAWSIGEVSSEMVDAINIHNASLLAMKRAVEGLFPVIPSGITKMYREESLIIGQSKNKGSPSASLRASPNTHSPSDALGLGRDDTLNVFLAIDGKFKIPNLDIHQESIVGGDNKVLSIAAASIVAKVYRDNLMRNLHKDFPAYNFAQHKGYATEHHRAMIIQNGLSPIHRLSFCQNITV